MGKLCDLTGEDARPSIDKIVPSEHCEDDR
jgi:hypothetical protein